MGAVRLVALLATGRSLADANRGKMVRKRRRMVVEPFMLYQLLSKTDSSSIHAVKLDLMLHNLPDDKKQCIDE